MARCWLVHDVSPEELQLADHVYKWGSPMHTHHGLVYQIMEAPDPPVDADADDLLDRIIILHLSFVEADSAKVHRCTLRAFLEDCRKGWQSGPLKRARYGVSWGEHMVKLPGTCYPFEPDAPAVTLRRAQALLQLAQLRPYDLSSLTSANCEHVIVWCKTGQWRSAQVDGAFGLARAAALAAGAAAACRSPGSGLLPLLGGVLLWKVAQQDAFLGVDMSGLPPELASAERLVLTGAAPGAWGGEAEVEALIAEIGGGPASPPGETEPEAEVEADAEYMVIEESESRGQTSPTRGPGPPSEADARATAEPEPALAEEDGEYVVVKT